MQRKSNIEDVAAGLRLAGESFVLATVVRTVSATAAKAGAKAIIRADGSIADGWIGGGCARGAVLKAAQGAIADGQSRLVSVQPEDLLAEHGVQAGSVKDGVQFATNMCPSKGTMDIFIEPVLPRPQLIILGSSPVAVALADLGHRFGFHCVVCAPRDEQRAFEEVEDRIEGFLLPAETGEQRYIIVSTQGRGDEVALRAALETPARHVAFVGSQAKAAALRDRLAAAGVSPETFDRLKAPAGHDIGAITPEEIALSIISEMIEIRRRGQRSSENRKL